MPCGYARPDMPERFVPMAQPYDLGLSLGMLQHGPRDPMTRVRPDCAWRATRTPEGPAAVRYQHVEGGVQVTAWGPGAAHALSAAPAVLGCEDQPGLFQPKDDFMRGLHRRFAGVRLPRTGAIMEALIPSVLEQKVTSREAWDGYVALVRRHGTAAPGPARLRLAPDPQTMAALPYFALHPFGVERRRADVLRRAAAKATRLEEAASMDGPAARERLRAIPGIGAWTAAEVTRVTHGDPDAVSVGDFHLPHTVAWALAGEARATDERMLEMLEPYRGQRGRAVRLIELAGFQAPAFGPRQRLRRIADI